MAPARRGTSSVAFRVAGHQDAALCFEDNFVCVFIRSGRLETRPVPDVVRRHVGPLLPPTK